MIYDVAVIGGGVVGCSVFSKLTRIGKKVVLLEKNNDVATGCSKANSGLVHAGFDCVPNTLKAKFNVEGNKIFPNLCQQLSIDYQRTGAVVVGNDKDMLLELLNRGKQNGVNELEILQDKELHSLVPNLNDEIKFGLYAKTAGLVSPYMLTIALAEEAVINGGEAVFNFEISSIKKQNDCFIISSPTQEICAKYIINASGFGYNEVANLLNSEIYPLTFKRGEYYVLDKCDFVNLTVFPLPTKAGKGVLATPTCAGNILLGPTSEPSDNNTETTFGGLAKIKENINGMFKNVPWNKVIREYSGIRVSCGDDFIVEKSQKQNNVINICGINSPGLSSAPAIANYVCELLGFGTNEKDFIKRKPYTKTSKMTSEELNKLISNNNSYGKIICRCEMITEGEILEAINSPLKPKTIDAIKKRVRAGMGRCQGGFCALKVCELIAKSHNIPFENIEKEDVGSYMMLCDIKPNKIKELE